MRQASRAGLTFRERLRRRGMRDRYVRPDASLLVAGFSWLHVSQPDPELLVSAARASYPAPGQAIWSHDAQPDRCHLSSVIVKMILITYKFDGRGIRADVRARRRNVAGRRQARGHSPPGPGPPGGRRCICSRPLCRS